MKISRFNSYNFFQILKNIFGCLILAFKTLSELKGLRIEGESLQKANVNIIIPLLSHSDPLFR